MYVAVFAVILGIVAIDQLIKYVVVNTLAIGQSIPVIDGVFHFTYVQNFGAAFSILQHRQAFLILLTGAVMIAVLFVLLRHIRTFDVMTIISLAMIVGGGVGNIIDRVRLGYVIDFLDVRLIQFPVFNFADCCIVIGAFLLLISALLFSKADPFQEAS